MKVLGYGKTPPTAAAMSNLKRLIHNRFGYSVFPSRFEFGPLVFLKPLRLRLVS
jgi:hypothetical protein